MLRKVAEMKNDSRIFVAGHRGLVGSAVLRRLNELGYSNVLTATRDQLDLRDQAAVNYWFWQTGRSSSTSWQAPWAASSPTPRGPQSSSTTT